ncbi:MAG: hypothetical protein RR909_03920 [Bacilli bacterium]
MRYLYKNIIIISIIAPISFGAAYFLVPLLAGKGPASSEQEKTSTQKFIGNLQNNFTIGDARIEVSKYEENAMVNEYLDKAKMSFTISDKLNLDFSGDVLLTGAIAGNLKAKFNTTSMLNMDLSFIESVAYLNFKEEHIDNNIPSSYSKKLKMSASNLMDVLSVLPISMPSLGEGLDMASLVGMISKLQDVSDKYKTDKYPYAFALPLDFDFIFDRYGSNIKLIFYGDENFEPTAIRLTSKVAVYGFEIGLEVDAMSIYKGEGIVAPLDDNTYQNMDGVVDVAKTIPNLMKIFDTKKTNINYEAALKVQSGKTLSIAGAFSLDDIAKNYGLSANVIDGETAKSFNIAGLYKDKTAYIDFADKALLGKMSNVTLKDMFDKINNLVKKYTKKDIMTTLNELIEDLNKSKEFDKLIANLRNLDSIRDLDSLIDIVTLPGSLSITLNSNVLGYEYGAIKLLINTSSSSTVLDSISLIGLKYGAYTLDFKLSISDFLLPSIEIANCEDFAPINSLLDIIPALAEQKQYAISGDVSILSSSSKKAPVKGEDITLSLAAQFDTTAQEYYGYAKLDDKTFNHYFRFDGERDPKLNDSLLYMLYDSSDRLSDDKDTKVKLKLGDIGDIFTTIQTFRNQIYKTDTNITDLGAYLSNLFSNPALTQAIYNAIFTCSGNTLGIHISSLPEIDKDGANKLLEIKMDSSIIGLASGTFDIKIGFNDTSLCYISLRGENVPSLGTIDGKLRLVTYDPHLESKPTPESPNEYRLDKSATYYNMSDIKLLISLGCNTGLLQNKKYWTINSTIKINLAGIYKLDVPFYVYIKNNNGAIELVLDIPSIPIMIANNGYVNVNGKDWTPTSRSVRWYYKDGLTYIDRTDKVKAGAFGGTKGVYHLVRKFDIFKALNRTTKDDNITPTNSVDNTLNVLSYVVEDTAYLGKLFVDIPTAIYGSVRKSLENTAVMKYEQLVKNIYHNTEQKHIFISLNFAELAKNTDMSKLDMYIFYDENMVLDKADIYMTASVGIDINIDIHMDLNLAAEENLSNELFSSMYNFVDTYKSFEPLIDSPIKEYVTTA